MTVKTIDRKGVKYVLVPQKAYRRMQERLDDQDDVRAYDRARAPTQEFIPAAIANRLIDGDNPIRVYREYRGMTQEALADAAGITKPYLSQLENERRVMSMRVLRNLAKVLKVDLGDLDPVSSPRIDRRRRWTAKRKARRISPTGLRVDALS